MSMLESIRSALREGLAGSVCYRLDLDRDGMRDLLAEIEGLRAEPSRPVEWAVMRRRIDGQLGTMEHLGAMDEAEARERFAAWRADYRGPTHPSWFVLACRPAPGEWRATIEGEG